MLVHALLFYTDFYKFSILTYTFCLYKIYTFQIKAHYLLPFMLCIVTQTGICLALVSIDSSRILNDVSSPMRYKYKLPDDDSYLNTLPAQTTYDALKSMGVKFFRYPGQEKLDNYLWSVCPWSSPKPTVQTNQGFCIKNFILKINCCQVCIVLFCIAERGFLFKRL